MKIPQWINILGYVYTVAIVDNFQDEIKRYIGKEDAENYAGYFSTDANMIWIDAHTSEQNKASVFLHEVIEIINAHLALNMPHNNIERLETALYQVLITNNMLK